MSLREFLLARIAEDEAVARAASVGPWVAAAEHQRWVVLGGPTGGMTDVASVGSGSV